MKILITIIFPFLLGLVDMDFDRLEPLLDKEDGHPEWVQEIMDRKPTMTKIIRCVHDDEFVWKVNSCVTCNDMITYVYDKDKNVVCEFGGVLRENTCKDNEIILESCKVIYKPSFSFR